MYRFFGIGQALLASLRCKFRSIFFSASDY
jgi:hypothetical protein